MALSKDGVCVFSREDDDGPNHAVKLGTFVDEALSFADSHLIALDAVAVSSGPGSYTGLRIGISMAKGVCFGRDLKLISVSTLQLLAVPLLLSEKIEEGALLCPMIDARRMEVYSAIYDRSLREVRGIRADIVDSSTYAPYLAKQPVCFFGNGAEKCMEVIADDRARFIKGVQPIAKWMFPIAEKRFLSGEFEDVAYFVPYYLKDFVAKKPAASPLAKQADKAFSHT